jgi:hypothetical protein
VFFIVKAEERKYPPTKRDKLAKNIAREIKPILME